VFAALRTMLELDFRECRLPRLFLVLPALCSLLPPPLSGQDDGTRLIPLYAIQVARKLNIPNDEQRLYGDLLRQNLADKTGNQAQYVVLVDRNKFVQAAMLFWMSPDGQFHLIGASPVSTGKTGQFDHFVTPTGVSSTQSTIRTFARKALSTKTEFAAMARKECEFMTSAGNRRSEGGARATKAQCGSKCMQPIPIVLSKSWEHRNRRDVFGFQRP
jgi:hypothetical protein